ncbi:MAG: DNA alkylation repair protein [Lachnospiraceae bacterium]|nr:DNA alkylation repair protein [Lachnospiraceae bacterium]
MRTVIRDTLISMSEPDYQKFAAGLLPGVDNILGVRLPKLRKYGKKVWKAYGMKYLEETLENPCNNNDIEYMEEIFLQGVVIGNLKVKEDVTLSSIQNYIKSYLPKINNWSTCDSFCAGLKIAKEYSAQMWEFIKPYLVSTRDYDVRFAIVMIINYYIQDDYIEELYKLFNKVGADWNSQSASDQAVYYVEMALAWAISICYVNYPYKTLKYLKEVKNQTEVLDDFTYNKALQKIVESRCVSSEEKAQIKLMKRK